MDTRHLTAMVVMGILATGASNGTAQVRERVGDPAQAREQVRDRDIYGSQLMTDRERSEYRDRMRAAKSSEERERIRIEHHASMQQRAKERGVALPEEPPTGGMGGMGPGGAGGGMGRGSGMGPGGAGGGMGPGSGMGDGMGPPGSRNR